MAPPRLVMCAQQGRGRMDQSSMGRPPSVGHMVDDTSGTWAAVFVGVGFRRCEVPLQGRPGRILVECSSAQPPQAAEMPQACQNLSPPAPCCRWRRYRHHRFSVSPVPRPLWRLTTTTLNVPVQPVIRSGPPHPSQASPCSWCSVKTYIRPRALPCVSLACDCPY